MYLCVCVYVCVYACVCVCVCVFVCVYLHITGTDYAEDAVKLFFIFFQK